MSTLYTSYCDIKFRVWSFGRVGFEKADGSHIGWMKYGVMCDRPDGNSEITLLTSPAFYSFSSPLL